MRIILILFGALITGSAHAQFGNLIKDLKSAVEGATQTSSQQTGAQQTSSQQTNPPVTTKQQPFVPGSKQDEKPAQTSSPPNSQKAQIKGPPAKSEFIAFQCLINGKEIIYRNNFDSDDRNINVRMANVYTKPQLMDYDWRTDHKDPLQFTEEKGNRLTVSTVYFKIKQMTYGISHCEGMMCGNPNQPYSFTIFDGSKKIKQEFCDEDTASEFNFPLKTDRNGKVSTQIKEAIIVKPSPLKFNPFN
jgi:Sec-independent protein translocase protein TatA